MDEHYQSSQPPTDNYRGSLLYETGPQYLFAQTHMYDDAFKRFPAQSLHGPTPSASPSSLSQPFDQPPSVVSSTSGASAQSTGSSAGGSPRGASAHLPPQQQAKWSESLHSLNLAPEIVGADPSMNEPYPIPDFESTMIAPEEKYPGFVDPTLIQQFDPSMAPQMSSAPQPGVIHAFPHLPSQQMQPQSPVTSNSSSYESQALGSRMRRSTPSPYLSTGNFQPYPQTQEARRFSIASSHSRNSAASPISNSFDDDGKEKGRCGECGRPFKDLKAHMLTHQSERPEKCPISTCSYHLKGFARKYDKNRHTLTHYKGTMVCGFCPGSGSSSEKSFNRADVFKRHLTAVHGVEQTPPNGRKKAQGAISTKQTSTQAGDATGKCSTCSVTFEDVQDFYEHLDDCVLRIVQQEEPSEAINEKILRAVNDDDAVQKTLTKHRLPTDTDADIPDSNVSDGDEGEPEDETLKEEMTVDSDDVGEGHTTPHGVPVYSGGGNCVSKSGRASGGRIQGMTVSKGGVPLIGKGRRRRKNYPASWGCTPEQMKMKKRVLCVYDGPRRLWKDDMMLDNDFEVRMRIGEGNTYVTDLDVETVKRANAFHEATEEEKGPWIEHDVDLDTLMS